MSRRAWLLLAAAVLGVACSGGGGGRGAAGGGGAGGAGGGAGGGPKTVVPGTTPTTPGPRLGPVPLPQATPPPGSVNVVSYGADPTGGKDSTVAIRKAISDAQQTAGTVVYIPAGHYILNLNDGAKEDFDIATNPIFIVGAGRDTTTLVEQIGAKSSTGAASKAIFQIQTGPGGQPGGGDGTAITGVTLDSATFDAGTTILDFANNTSLSQLSILGARSDHQYNPDQFGVRVIAICNHTDLATKHRGGNKISDVIVSGQGSAGNTDLDLSCQIKTSVSNLTDHGNGMDIYISNDIDVSNYTFTPGTVQASPKSYIITGPSDTITLSNITTYGNGGQFQPSPNGYSISNVTISHETMKDLSSELLIGDANQIGITDSTIGVLKFNPVHAAADVVVTNTTIASVACTKRGLVTGLVGTQC